MVRLTHGLRVTRLSGSHGKGEKMSEINVINVNGTPYDVGGSDGGITPVAQALLINILRAGTYVSDQSTNITNLETELARGGGGTRVAVINNLTNCTNSNSAISVEIGSSYVATLTADEGYELDTVTLLMNGVDVTSLYYGGGRITIASVTGVISITAVAISQSESGLIHYWDFKSGSLIDTIDGETAALVQNGMAATSGVGIEIDDKTEYVIIPFPKGSTHKAKIQFGQMDFQGNDTSYLICVVTAVDGTPQGVLRYYPFTTNLWQVRAWTDTEYANPNVFRNKELIIERGTGNGITLIYDGVKLLDDSNIGIVWNYIVIGRSGSTFFDAIVESVKTYEEVTE